jgi:CheY-like chemotaxis protein
MGAQGGGRAKGGGLARREVGATHFGPVSEAHCHTVLVVEDDWDTREALMLLVQSEGVDAAGARNGQDALEQLRGGLRPCLIVLDLAMPVMTGYEFRQAQLADPDLASIPVALLQAAPTSKRNHGSSASRSSSESRPRRTRCLGPSESSVPERSSSGPALRAAQGGVYRPPPL